ncbi:MFS transporter [Salinigranum marinum]|uniref:MFS transporter n=1 Tax=Salinigranum marinum TaxID=1515595 RepID=UPI002989FE86|nr:MFS transporter [Salinigranum marinum]
MAFLVNLARVVFAPLVGQFIVVFDVGEATAGTIATLVWLGSALPRLPAGWLLTRVPRHRVVLGTGVVLTVASLFTAAADTVVTVGAGALLMGLSSGVYFVAANPLVSELYPERVGRAMGTHGTASQIAAVAAAPLVTLALVVSWRVVFVGTGVVAFLVTLALVVTARRTDLPDAGVADRDLLAGIRREWRLIAVGVVILGVTGFVWQGLFNFYELYMRTKGLSPTMAKNTLTVVFAAGVPAFVVSGRLADRLPHVPYLLGVVAAFAGSVFLLTRTTGLLALLVVTAVVGYVIHSLFPAMDTFLLDTLPDETRGSAYAAYSGAMMLTQAGGSSAVGTLVEGGLAYDAVFSTFAVGLGAVVAVLGALRLAGLLPGTARGRAAESVSSDPE